METVAELKHFYFAYKKNNLVLHDIDFKIEKGSFTVIAGPSGSGKTTLCKAMAGIVPFYMGGAYSGEVMVLGESTKGKKVSDIAMRLGLMLEDYESQLVSLTAGEEVAFSLLNHGFKPEEVEERTRRALEDVGLPGRESYQLDELSGGQRSKVLLTKLLLQNSSILLLDEPTNYLDVEHIEWLTKFLQNYENAFILISHDISFLNKVVNVIYHLENCELTRYTGNYDKFQEMYAIYKAQKEAAYERQQQEVAKLEDFIARNKARVATTNMAKSRQKKLDKMEMIEKPREKPKAHFQFKEARTPSRYLAVAEDLVLGYDTPLTRPVSFKIECGQKIAIRGVNGLGKTTLLKTILGIIPPISGKIELGQFLEPGYFEQEEREKNENTALEDVWNEYPGMTNYEVRAALAACGLTNEHITSKVFVLSGGEAAKVRLCKLMLKNVNWLVLDEPTNHLDVDAKAELKRALIDFKGSVLLVSHEPEFYEDWVTSVWNIEDWTTKII